MRNINDFFGVRQFELTKKEINYQHKHRRI